MTKITRKVNTREIRDQELEAELEAEIVARQPDPEDSVPQNAENPADKTDWRKRHGDLKSFHDKSVNELRKEVDLLRTQLTDAAKKQIKFPKSEEEVTEWISKYPDVAAIVETIAMKKVAELRGEVEDQRAVLKKSEFEVAFARCTNKITKEHPDFFELREDENFVSWIQTQPKYVRTAFDDDLELDDLEDAAETVINALELYKLKNKKPEPKKNDNAREAARSVGTRSSAAPKDTSDGYLFKESDVEKMHIREYEKHEAAILKAISEGKFFYDISGAAR